MELKNDNYNEELKKELNELKNKLLEINKKDKPTTQNNLKKRNDYIALKV